ncbi:MAG TPA: phosphosulfolactate synthase [Chloroflexota bacterium]|nr:phosphosulfolactate synthase [Chloroflexota bacterium]
MISGRFAPMLELSEKPDKPRRLRRTMVFDRGWPSAFIEGFLEGFAPAIDIAKISAWHLHQTEAIVRRKIAMYKHFGIEPMCGGPVLELARLQHKEEEVLRYLRDLGFEGLEISSESLPTQEDIELDRHLAHKCLDLGFVIHGEVGKKFPQGDQVRDVGGRLNIDVAVRTFNAYRDMGCDSSYFEGHLLRSICGDMAEREEGRPVLVELVERVGLENIIFEIPGTYLHYAGKRALQGLLVYLFGPDVNMGNILIEEMPELEEIREGTFPTFGAPNGDHPWLASLALTGTGKAAPQWWRGPATTEPVG